MLLLYSGTFSFWISVFVAYTLNITAVEIQSIDITISCGMTGYSWYPDPVPYDTHWTLWYDSEIYQFTVPSGSCDALSYSPTDFIVHDHCSTDQHICSTEPCIMIESPIGNTDAILIDEVRFWTSEVTWYGISGRCMDDTLLSLQPWLDLDNDYYDPYYENYLGCASGQSNTWICIDDRDESCKPRKPILYFDLERPNQYIMDAVWSDGTNVFPETYSCDPTNSTTEKPTAIATTVVSETSAISTTNEPTTVIISTDTQITNTKLSTTDSETEYVLEEAEVLHSSQIPFAKTDSDVDQDVFQENVDIDWSLIGACAIILILCCGICGAVYVLYVQRIKIDGKQFKNDIQMVNDDNDKKIPKLEKDENIEKEMDINIEMDDSGLFGIHPIVTVQGAPPHQMNTKCSECGISSAVRVNEGQVFVCTTCKALDDINVNRRVSDMFRSNNMQDITPNVTTDGYRTALD